jgi:hypothetical protein
MQNGMTDSKPLVYLACPHTHVNPQVREYRYLVATEVAAKLLVEGTHVYSPVTHSHPMLAFASFPDIKAFWQEVDLVYLKLSKKLIVVCIDGWKTSAGVQDAIAFAKAVGIDIEYFEEVSILDIVCGVEHIKQLGGELLVAVEYAAQVLRGARSLSSDVGLVYRIATLRRWQNALQTLLDDGFPPLDGLKQRCKALKEEDNA